MDSADAAVLLQLEELREVAEALLRMTREGAYGHVTVRFEAGTIRQVDTLTTVRTRPPAEHAVRPAA